MWFLLLKTVHILSAIVLLGTGFGTAFHLWATHRRGDVRAIASAARNTVLADWLFIATSGVMQPVTGIALARAGGYDLAASWLLAAYALYALAGICWLAVVWLQLRVAAISAACAKENARLPPAYFRAMRIWFMLGWPGFLGLILVVWLMVAKPALW
jgi:uncharacterized membrane protein